MDFVALISGGKDSFYSILHCVRNNYRLVALLNLHPPPSSGGEGEDIEEMNSFMYQTVGCNVIPLYPRILNMPLYRAPITGSSVNTELAYHPYSSSSASSSSNNKEEEDETEDLYRLLKSVLKKHPSVKAVSSGAILSTYQRTRVESACGRLGLTSLSWLWQRSQGKLLEEMHDAGLDARIIKVASGGLDESLLGLSVAHPDTRRKLEKISQEWGGNVAGEGGEFETIVYGCRGWPSRVEVVNSKVVKEEGGVSWLQISECKLAPAEDAEGRMGATIAKPSLLEPEFQSILDNYGNAPSKELSNSADPAITEIPPLSVTKASSSGTYYIGNVTSAPTSLEKSDCSPPDELCNILQKLRRVMDDINATARNITSSLLLIRSMSSFGPINEVYKSFFSSFPNPPSRVCIAIGDTMPANIHVILSVVVDTSKSLERKALHVQSRSYWAPANVGPYSQAISVDGLVSVAGMIGLVPETMQMWTEQGAAGEAVLALQHMVRVGREVGAHGKTGWAGAVAYVREPQDAAAAEYAWESWFGQTAAVDDGEEEVDGDEASEGASEKRGEFEKDDSDVKEPPTERNRTQARTRAPPMLVVQVDDLPINARVEYAPIGIDAAYLHQKLLQHAEEEEGESDAEGGGGPCKVRRSYEATSSLKIDIVDFGMHSLGWGTLKVDAANIASAVGKLSFKGGNQEMIGCTIFVPPGLASATAKLVEELSTGCSIRGVMVVPVKGILAQERDDTKTWSFDTVGIVIRSRRKKL